MKQKNRKKTEELSTWLRLAGITLVVAALGLVLYLVRGSGNIEIFFEDLVNANPWLLLTAGIVMAGGVSLLVLFGKKNIGPMIKKRWDVQELVVGALCISLAFVLSFIKIWEMPMGGSITPASMLPIIVFSYIYGTKKGMLVALTYGCLQMLQDLYVVHWAQFILDYLLAFAVLSTAGLFKKHLLPGILLAGVLRFLCSYISGFIFFAEYAPSGQSPLLYSLLYNGTYMLPDTLICITVTLIPGMRRSIEALKAKALRQQITAS